MRDLRDVAVFWDMDSCPVPSQLSGFAIVDKIRLLTQSFGTIKSFKGYGDLLDLQISKVFQLRSELQSSGVSLIDCPATERRSISSRMMIVDLLTHAVDNSQGGALVVIAGNSDFSYAVSILRLRRYQVVLVCPKDRVGPHSQASLYLDWFHDVLGDEYKVDDTPNAPDRRRPRSNTNSSSLGTTHTPTYATPFSQDTPDHEPQMPLSTDTTEPSVTTPHEHPHEASSHQEPVDVWHGEDSGGQQSASPPAETEISKPQEGALDQLTNSSIIFDFEDHIQRPSSAPPSYSSFSPAPSPLTYDFHPPAALHPFTPAGPSFLGTLDEGQTSDYGFTHHEVGELSRPEPPPRSPISTSTETVVPSPASTLTPLHPNISPSLTIAPSTSGRTTASETPKRPTASTTPRPMSRPPSNPTIVSPFSTPQPSPLVVSKSALPKLAPGPVMTTPILAPIPVPASVPNPPPVRRLAPRVIPSHFRDLVKKLQEYQAQGDYQPFRPGIAALMISSNSGDMQAVGATSFTQYAQLAEQAGIVDLPEKPGEFWISLRPELADAQV